MQPMVRMRSIEGFEDAVTELGFDAEPMLARVGIAAGAVRTRPEDWISCATVYRAYEVAAAETRCDTFGLRFGQQRQLSFMGPLYVIMEHSPDLDSCLRTVGRFLSIQTTGVRLRLDLGDEEATLQYLMAPQLRRWANQWMEESLLYLLRSFRSCLGPNYVPRYVSMRHAAISGDSTYTKFFDAPVRTNAAMDAITFRREDLAAPNPRRNDELLKVVTAYLHNYAAPSPEDFVGTVNALLRRALATGHFSLATVADQLGSHSRTLQRRLRDQGCTFEDLLDDVRCQTAKHYLNTGQLPITQIAQLLGYSEQSAFNHAFRRWYGQSPREWRQSEAMAIAERGDSTDRLLLTK
jgi:AraC-like DNA-binding protein